MPYKSRKDIKVPESYIQKIRDTKTKSAAIKKYGKTTDPKMQEAMRRFYGNANVISAPTSSASRKDTPRESSMTRPRSSVPIKQTTSQTKPKSNAQKVDSFVRGVYKYAGPENFVAGGLAVKGAMTAGKAANKLSKTISIAKNTKTLKTATGSKANLARTKIGYARGLATKGEVRQAKSAVSSTAKQRVSSAARTGKDTAKYYGSAAKNMSTRAQKAGEMRSTQQAVASAAKKKAGTLKAAETRAKKAAAAKRASKAGK